MYTERGNKSESIKEEQNISQECCSHYRMQGFIAFSILNQYGLGIISALKQFFSLDVVL